MLYDASSGEMKAGFGGTRNAFFTRLRMRHPGGRHPRYPTLFTSEMCSIRFGTSEHNIRWRMYGRQGQELRWTIRGAAIRMET